MGAPESGVKIPRVGAKIRVYGRGGVGCHWAKVAAIEYMKLSGNKVEQPYVIVKNRLINGTPVEVIYYYRKSTVGMSVSHWEMLVIRYALKYPPE